MKFGPIPVSGAAGAILAHTARLADGIIKKGTRLDAQMCARLAADGRDTVIAAVLETGDIDEDTAAEHIAQAVCGPHVHRAEAFTGRVNLFAQSDGLACIDAERLIALNKISHGLTVATLPRYAPVTAGQMVATVKIIPFALHKDIIVAAENLLRTGSPVVTTSPIATTSPVATTSPLPASAPPPPSASSGAIVSVAPFTPHRAHLILTTLPGTKPTVLTKRIRAVQNRLQTCGSSLISTTQVPHDAEKIAKALKTCLNTNADLVLIFGASAIVDEQDIIPTAIHIAGGTVARMGMPVDPGNLLLLGACQTATVIGLPSCASSPKLNGFDWVLERTLANLPITSDDISQMALGGLLMEIPSRPQPRETPRPTTRTRPKIAALILAAGRSTRMGKANKLLEDLAGAPLVQRVHDAAKDSNAASVFVVTGHESDRVTAALSGTNATFVHNPNYADGLATSLVAGLEALPPSFDGVVVLLGDMPHLTASQIDKLIAAFDPDDARGIVIPTHKGKRGNPILWAQKYFPDMKKLTGDVGAKTLLQQYSDDSVEVSFDTAEVLSDIDTPEALAEARANAR